MFEIAWGSSGLVQSTWVAKNDALTPTLDDIMKINLHVAYPYTSHLWRHRNKTRQLPLAIVIFWEKKIFKMGEEGGRTHT